MPRPKIKKWGTLGPKIKKMGNASTLKSKKLKPNFYVLFNVT